MNQKLLIKFAKGTIHLNKGKQATYFIRKFPMHYPTVPIIAALLIFVSK